jgi:ubiquinone/menaquinone biosynthesis C-methylase UbiE
MKSLSFDRASEFYDATRGLPEDIMDRVIDLLAAELSPGKTCLEIGVGTGRIALSLAEKGISLAGLDLSEPMLRRLVKNAGGRIPFPLVRGDSIQIPFADNSFEAALACHVLHLIPAWQTALDELIRVARPDGVILVDWGDRLPSPWSEALDLFTDEAGVPRHPRGAKSEEDIDDAMRARGAGVRMLETITGTRKRSFRNWIDAMERGTYSITWDADQSSRTKAAGTLRQWVKRNHGSLDEERDVPVNVSWRAYDLP